jgi:hypothetical protein
MNIPKIQAKTPSNNTITFNINKYFSKIQTRYQNQVNLIVKERHQKSNKLLFWMTVIALFGIMGGTIFLGFNQSQPQQTSRSTLSNQPLKN